MDSVGENISLKAAFNDLCGFTEADITTLLKSLAGGGLAGSAAEALAMRRHWR